MPRVIPLHTELKLLQGSQQASSGRHNSRYSSQPIYLNRILIELGIVIVLQLGNIHGMWVEAIHY